MEKTVKILLIEDDKLDQIQVRRVLDQRGILYQLRIAGTVDDAWQFLENEKHVEFVGNPDIILLDINLPRINGLEFLSEFRIAKKWESIKVFILSNSEQEKKEVDKIGVSGYITKPLKLNSPSRDTISFLIDVMNIMSSSS
jgi:DNA-binding response OmpR family regulator